MGCTVKILNIVEKIFLVCLGNGHVQFKFKGEYNFKFQNVCSLWCRIKVTHWGCYCLRNFGAKFSE